MLVHKGVAVAKSYWSFSGRFWAGWSGTIAGLLAFVVAMPGAPDKQQNAKATASPMSVMMEKVDFGALPETAFGDYEHLRDKH